MRKIFTMMMAMMLVLVMVSPAFAGIGMSASEVKTVKPSGVKAATYSYSKIKVTWDEIDGVDGYQVYRATSKGGKYSKAYTTSNPEKTYYINTNRTTGKTYYYKVRGYKKIGGKTYYTKYSSVVSAYARPNKVKVKNVVADLGWHMFFNLEWDKVSGASGYQVYMREKGEDKYTWMGNFKDTWASIEFYDETKLYDFKVRAYRTVNGKKVYGYFSEVANYEFDWTPEMLKEYAEEYVQEEHGLELKYMWDGVEPITPDNSSWSAHWPVWYSFYYPWGYVKNDIREVISSDLLNYEGSVSSVCIYLDESEVVDKWVGIYMLS